MSVDEQQPARDHSRRPPLAEIDTWELWQAWRRGERALALPWFGLLLAFCLLLAAMYSFFFFTTRITDDAISQVGLTFIFLGFLYVVWERISPKRSFALIVVAAILATSGSAFLLWLLLYSGSGWSPLIAIVGVFALVIAGLLVGLLSLNAIARRQGSAED